MYTNVDSIFTAGAALANALSSIPLVIVDLVCSAFLLIVFFHMDSRVCHHRHFGITYITFALFSLVADTIFSSILVRALPWLGRPPFEAAVMRQWICKLMSFLGTFLAGCKVNLLLAHCLIHVFSFELHYEPADMTWTVPFLNTVCILLAAIMAITSAIVHGIWVIGNRLVCLPDPEWPQLFISYYMTHKALFCDGIIQSLVILVSCIVLRRIYIRIGVTVRRLIFITDSKFLLFEEFRRFKERLMRKQECIRVVYSHAVFIALVRIARGIMTLRFSEFLYGTYRSHIFRNQILLNLVYYFSFFDVLGLVELLGDIFHAWWAFYFQSTMRNTFLNFFSFPYKSFKNCWAKLSILFYYDAPKVERISEREAMIFDRNFSKYASLLASQLSDEDLSATLMWLKSEPYLPKEISAFLAHVNYTRISSKH
ncbi:hypothetical protein Aperf_G00000074077 [Anoplocephala perfoliata]